MSFVASAVVLRRSILTFSKRILNDSVILKPAYFSSGEWGSGAGKGGGSGGAVREAGGSFGKMEAAREEEYFKKLQRKQLLKLKQHIKEEISHHEKMIAQHQEAISRHTDRIKDLKQQVEIQKNVEKEVNVQKDD